MDLEPQWYKDNFKDLDWCGETLKHDEEKLFAGKVGDVGPFFDQAIGTVIEKIAAEQAWVNMSSRSPAKPENDRKIPRLFPKKNSHS